MVSKCYGISKKYLILQNVITYKLGRYLLYVKNVQYVNQYDNHYHNGNFKDVNIMLNMSITMMIIIIIMLSTLS